LLDQFAAVDSMLYPLGCRSLQLDEIEFVRIS
jgi:hypothetical protein